MNRPDRRRETYGTAEFWDELISGQHSRTDPQPEMAAVIERILAADRVPDIDPAFADHLADRLDHLATQPPVAATGRRGTFSCVPRLHWPRMPSVRPHALVIITILVILGSLFAAYLPDNMGQDNRPARLAAPESTFADSRRDPDVDGGTSGGGASRTGQAPGPAPSGAPEIAWKIETYSSRIGGLVVDKDHLFVSSFNDSTAQWFIRSYFIADGRTAWSTQLEGLGTDFGSPVAADGHVYIRIGEQLTSLDPETGTIDWQIRVNRVEPYRSGLAVVDGVIYLADDRSTLVALTTIDGSRLWDAPYTPYRALWTSVVGAGITLIRTEQGELIALDAKTGAVQWTYQDYWSGWSSPVISDGRVIFASRPTEKHFPPQDTVVVLDATTGQPELSTVHVRNNRGYSFSILDHMLIVSSSNYAHGSVDAIDLGTGNKVWTWQGGGFLGQPVIVDGQVFVRSDSLGTITGLNLVDGSETWSVYLASASIGMIVDHLLLTSNGDTITAVAGNEDLPYDGSTPDLSGLGRCTPPRATPTTQLTGEPVHVIDAETNMSNFVTESGSSLDYGTEVVMRWLTIAPSNVPQGTPSPPQKIASIQDTLRAMNTCRARPEAVNDQAAFFTDDFYRRGDVPFAEDRYQLDWNLGPNEDQINAIAPVQLADGRIAATFGTYESWDVLIVFIEQDGQWLIDEVLAIEA